MFRSKPTRYAPPNRQVAGATSIPPPVAGLNARDSVANMNITDAVVLDNLFPQKNAVELRRGCEKWITAESAAVETLIPYTSVGGTRKLFGMTGVVVRDYTTQLTPSTVGPAITNARWQYTGFTNAFANFFIAVNGADAPMAYNGTVFSAPTYTAEPGDSLTPANLIQVIAHHRRLWFVEKNSTSAWYGGVDEYQGTLYRFDFGEMFPRGGYLMAVGSWTVDNGTGLNDLLVAISSEGDVVVYQGFDPNSVDFSLVGRFACGRPLGRRCMTRYIGDLLILTREGVVPMSGLVAMRDAADPTAAITDRIQALISEATTAFGDEFGWEMLYVPEFNQLYVNVPDTLGSVQFVMNTITKAWCRFTGYNAKCFAVFNLLPFFGMSTGVNRGYYNYFDNYDTTTGLGDHVTARAVQAFSYFDSPGKQKHFRMARPIFIAANEPFVAINLAPDYEYDDDDIQLPVLSGPRELAIWDTAIWDAAYWTGSLTTFKRWYTVNPIGFCAAVAMAISNNAQTQWVATDVVYEGGGVL
jgi:hypothetical protein